MRLLCGRAVSKAVAQIAPEKGKVMVSKVLRILAVLARRSAPAGAFAPEAPRRSSGRGQGLVGRLHSRRDGARRQRSRRHREAVTDGDGGFAAASLAAGAYRVEASLDGFETAVRRVSLDAGQFVAVELTLAPAGITEGVVVTARRSEEVAQEVPIPLSVVSGKLMNEAGAFNVNRLKELIPTVQFYSTNPRNSAINIRGLGAPFGLTNDGIEPGVGLYIDGVFYARPASASLDFVDVERIEVLRGPQGTLFGKNTTAGAINVTTRKPTFRPESDVEINYGNLGFVQAKASVSGPLFSQKVAGRLSFSGTQRDGTVANVKTGAIVNDLDNLGLRGSVLFVPSEKVVITAAVDHTRQRPQGYTQVVAGVAPTLRPANRQYAQIAADLGYTAPSFNAFDRVTDVDTPLRSYQDLGGETFNIDFGLGSGRLTSTTSRRYWELESVERPRLHRPAGHHGFGRAVGPGAVDPGSALGRRPVAQGEPGRRRLRLPPGPRLRAVVPPGAGLGRRALPPRADRRRRHPGPPRRLRLRPVHDVPQRQRRGLRPGVVAGDRSPAAAAGAALQLRPEERGLRPAGLRRPADHGPGAHRVAALGARAAAVRGRRGRHEPVGAVHRGLQGDEQGQRVFRPTRPASSRWAST